MSLTIIESNDEIDDPTDHPHIHEEKAPPLPEQDEDTTYYLLSVKGSGTAITFFKAMLVGHRLDDNMYMHAELGEMRNLSITGISENSIYEVIEIFETLAEDINSIEINGDVDGSKFTMDIWDGELQEEERSYITTEE